MSEGIIRETPFSSLFPSSTSIKDFGYPHAHPLRNGDFTIADNNDSDSELSDREDFSLEEEDFYTGGGYTPDEINCKAIALFDFTPENDNEVALKEGQVIWISYRHGQGWLVAEDPETGENGLVPEEYVEAIYDPDNDVGEDTPKPFLPDILQNYNKKVQGIGDDNDSENDWVDTDYDEDENETLNNDDTDKSAPNDVKSISNGMKNITL